ncbi:hypothetical protein EGW08_005180 [Elysia chlorotica]|uniref:Cordon-bleu ubiquitin-like domain-containing protein n=1 Tax=Elysia chlorotica TaxID=188477 RepID=A0A433TZM5_ELYCH|nr:hypothetical protein EGW08_005180 [Elysia chlorotica]
MSRAGKLRPNGPTPASTSTSVSNGKSAMPSSNMTTATSPSSSNYIINNNSSSSNNNHHNQMDSLNGSTGNSFSEMSDEASSSEPENGPITLDVELPSGQHTDIVVEHGTPMIDLLVSLAGKCRVNPTGLLLQLLDPDTGQPLTYKPNQTIGFLGGREVRLVPRDSKSKNDRKQEKPFEMTHRFTMNLPRGQKTVVRVSPLITLGQLMTSVCEDKSLDLRRHVLQIPGQPGVKVDLAATIQELGRHELNLVAVGLQDPRSHMVSMPDLSKPPPSSFSNKAMLNAPMGGEVKKKRGFLSFLSKSKDKKYRQSMETSSTTSHVPRGPNPPSSRQATTPPAQRRQLSESPHRPNHPDTRPKSMFIAAAATPRSDPSGNHTNSQPHPSQQQHYKLQQQPLDITAGTGKKKRRAPAPPCPTADLPSALPSREPVPPEGHRSQVHNGGHPVSETLPEKEHEERQHQANHQREPEQPLSRAELLSRLHSRNSSDSSGYHELPLSGAESPEALGYIDLHTAEQLKTSSASISSGLDGSVANGDSGVHDLSPMRVSPIQEVSEKIEPPASSSKMAVSASAPAASSSGAGKKKRKAPAPPGSVPSSESPRPPKPVLVQEEPAPSLKIETIAAVEAQVHASMGRLADAAPSQLEADVSSEEPTPRESSTPNGEVEETHAVVLENEKSSAAAAISTSDESKSKYNTFHDDSDSDDGADYTNTGFDINDILEGVTFDDDPVPIDLRMVGSRDTDMVMEETDSIISETVDQVETSRNERPCAFIPPPPPDEPPPPEVEPVDSIASLTRKADPVLVDKGTGVNEDNASLAPSSAKSSPGADRKRRDSFTSLDSVDTIEGLSMDFEQAIQMGEESLYLSLDDVTVPSSYKSEMALFVERMSKMAVETSGGGSGQNDDSVSSLSLPASENSDTGSVIQHVRSGSQDSRVSGSDSGGSLRGLPHSGQAKDKVCLPMTEEINVPIETVPPPPEFGDEDKEDGNEDDDDEEYYTETVEELIIPLTPHGYDFSAAQKVEEETVVTKLTPREEESREARPRSGSTGVFRAELVSIAPVYTNPVSTPRPPTPPVVKETPLPVASSAPARPSLPSANPAEKEEFVLTLEDLDSVSFLPPKPPTPRTTSLSSADTPVSPGFVSSAAFVMENHGQQETNSPRGRSTMSFLPSEQEDSVMETKPLTTYRFPTTVQGPGRLAKSSAASKNSSPRSDDSHPDAGSDPLTDKLSPRLLVDSSYSSMSKYRSSYEPVHTLSSPSTASSATTLTLAAEPPTEVIRHNEPDTPDETDSPATDDREDENNRSIDSGAELDPQEALAAQYSALQAQFAQWQTQLSQNQALLSAQSSPGVTRASRAGPELQAEHLQQLSEQVLVQQQMMQQLQQTMHALQQQQQQKVQGADNNGAGNSSSTPEVAQIAAPPPPPPPPPPSAQGAPKTFTGIPKVRTLDSPRPAKQLTSRQSRFEPVLDPREELMLAIRGFKGREGLRSVPVQQTKWVHSNR